MNTDFGGIFKIIQVYERYDGATKIHSKCKLNNTELFLKLFHRAKKLETTSITVDKIYYLRSLFVFFLRILVFKFISKPQKTGRKTESCGNLLKLDLSE